MVGGGSCEPACLLPWLRSLRPLLDLLLTEAPAVLNDRVTPVRYKLGMAKWTPKGMPSTVRGGARVDARLHRAHTIDEHAAAVAKGQGSIDLALGETLLELSKGDRLMDLCYSKLVDYGYERLGLPKRTLYMLRELATGLHTRPLLRKAVLVGAVSPRKALTIMPMAVGDDEAAWTGAGVTRGDDDVRRGSENAEYRKHDSEREHGTEFGTIHRGFAAAFAPGDAVSSA